MKRNKGELGHRSLEFWTVLSVILCVTFHENTAAEQCDMKFEMTSHCHRVGDLNW